LGTGVTSLTPADTANGDIYIAKYRSDGTFVWAQKMGWDGRESVSGIATRQWRRLRHREFPFQQCRLRRQRTLTTTGGADVFLLKMSGIDGTAVTTFDGDGQLQFGGSNGDSGTSLAVDGNGHVLVGGAFSSSDAGFDGAGVFASGGVTQGFVFRVSATTGAVDATFGAAGGLIGPGILPNPASSSMFSPMRAMTCSWA